jgi:L-ascorbate metabolism protein UlaG (beta-lactamase superfamily)
MAMTVHITRVAHSCHLIEIGGLTLLTDPWFSTKPDYHPGEPVAFSIDQLPDLDAVLISHEHYDHCDLDTFKAYRNLGVPLITPATVTDMARAAGFTDVTALQPWQNTTIGDVTVTAAPGLHGVYEITYIIGDGSANIYFAGDTLLIPAVYEIPQRIGDIDVMLMPTNGLRIIPMHDMQVVMNADQAAELVAAFAPRLAMPHHSAFTDGPDGEDLHTHGDRDPRHFAEAVARRAPGVEVRITTPGERVEVA